MARIFRAVVVRRLTTTLSINGWVDLSAGDFADHIDETGPYMKVRAQALILAGEREQAAACMEAYQHCFPQTHGYWKDNEAARCWD